MNTPDDRDLNRTVRCDGDLATGYFGRNVSGSDALDFAIENLREQYLKMDGREWRSQRHLAMMERLRLLKREIEAEVG